MPHVMGNKTLTRPSVRDTGETLKWDRNVSVTKTTTQLVMNAPMIHVNMAGGKEGSHSGT